MTLSMQPKAIASRREKGLAREVENKLQFETAIRRVIATAAREGTLTTASDHYGLTPEQIMAAPLPEVRGSSWVQPRVETAAAIAAEEKAKAEGAAEQRKQWRNRKRVQRLAAKAEGQATPPR